MLPKRTKVPTLKILLAEDDDHCAEMIKWVLEKFGHIVTYCTNGNNALDALKNSTFDLAILDIKMPRIDGAEIIKNIKELNKNLPIILMTGLSKNEVQELLARLNSPKLYYIAKPILLPELVEKIDSIFGFYGSSVPFE